MIAKRTQRRQGSPRTKKEGPETDKKQNTIEEQPMGSRFAILEETSQEEIEEVPETPMATKKEAVSTMYNKPHSGKVNRDLLKDALQDSASASNRTTSSKEGKKPSDDAGVIRAVSISKGDKVSISMLAKKKEALQDVTNIKNQLTTPTSCDEPTCGAVCSEIGQHLSDRGLREEGNDTIGVGINGDAREKGEWRCDRIREEEREHTEMEVEALELDPMQD